MAKRYCHLSAQPATGRLVHLVLRRVAEREHGVAESKGSLYPFRPASPRTSPLGPMQSELQAWPATGGTVTAPLHIAQANAQHLDTVLGLIDDARTWLWTKNTNQWEEPWPTTAVRDARVLKGLQNGKTWIVWDGAIAAATVTIATVHNPAVWSKKPPTEADMYM